MQISLAQLDQIHSARRAAYCWKLCEELRTEATEQVAQRDPEELLATVSDAVGRATRYGIVGGDGIRRFVKLAVLVDPRFDELPAVQSFLGLADLDPDLKIKMLSDLAAVQLRNKAS